MPVSVFSTVGLPAACRVERWESHNAAALIGLDVRADGPLEATEVNLQLPVVRLARVRGSAHAVERTQAVIGRCPADSIAVYLTLRGEASFTSADGTRRLHPGDALVCATDHPFARGFARGLEELVVTVPCAALRTHADISLPSKPTTTTFRTDFRTGTGAYARALARLTGRATGRLPELPPDEATVLDLVAVLAAGEQAAMATAHRAAARCYIEEHFTDPNLGAERIAAAIGISERHLSRVFAADGTSVPRHVLVRRLRLAHAMLAADQSVAVKTAAGERWRTALPNAASRLRPTSPTRSAPTSDCARPTSAAKRRIPVTQRVSGRTCRPLLPQNPATDGGRNVIGCTLRPPAGTPSKHTVSGRSGTVHSVKYQLLTVGCRTRRSPPRGRGGRLGPSAPSQTGHESMPLSLF